MAMTREQAFCIGQTTHKLRLLDQKAQTEDDHNKIQAQMDRLRPYIAEAATIVIRETDADFAQLGNALSAQTKDLDDAIAGIKEIAAGIANAAQVINGLVAVLGAVAKL